MIESLISLYVYEKEVSGVWVIKYSIPMAAYGFSGNQQYCVEVEDADPEKALEKACQELKEFFRLVRQPI